MRMSRFILLYAGSGLALCLNLGGCLGGPRHASTPDRRPAMPTVALPSAATTSSGSESEVLASSSRAARSGDIEGVLRVLKSVGDASLRARLATELMTQLRGNDPKFTAQLALALGNEFDQMGIVEVAGHELARHDPDFALRWAVDLPPGAASRRMGRAIMDELVAADPRAALDRVAALPAGAVRDDALVMAAGAWARRDPDAAIDWLGGRPDDHLKSRLTSAVGFEVAQTRPERAIAVAETLPEGRDRWLLFSAIAQTWVAVDSKAALAWAGKLPGGEARDAALSGIDTGFGVPRSRRVAGVSGIRGGSSRTRGGTAAAAAWPEISSPAFAAWLTTQPRGMSREEAILEYIRQRGALEPAAVRPLLESMSPGYARDQAMDIYLDGLLIGSPMEAARWVRSLPRSERTNELLEKTARRLLLTHPDTGADWIEQSTLPPERKEQLLRGAGR